MCDRYSTVKRPSDHSFCKQVFAKSYRAPELLMGSRRYGPEVDIWAAGCIFAELITGHRLFRVGNVCCGEAKTVSEQLIAIFETFGTPSKAQWPGMKSLPNYVKLEYCSAQSYKTLFPRTNKDCRALLQGMFTYDPEKRITAQQALEHRYSIISPAYLWLAFVVHFRTRC